MMEPHECEHGRLLGQKCELCEHEREIAELRAALDIALKDKPALGDYSKAAANFHSAWSVLYEQNHQLRAEIDRLKSIQQPTCGECGYTLEEVRPGKHQCSYCELAAEVESLQSLRPLKDLLGEYSDLRKTLAGRCIQIVNEQSNITNSGQARRTIEAIKKEFWL